MKLDHLNLSFGTQVIFNDVNVWIPKKEKVGIVGVNGAGKTTFFKILMGELEPDSGRIQLDKERVGFLPQIIEVEKDNMTVFDYLLEGRPIKKLEKKLQDLYDKVGIEENLKEQKKLYKEIDKTQRELEYWGIYEAESELLKIIDGMHLEELLDNTLMECSGGEKSKVAFAKILYEKPEILLLDEPTNHLDSSTRDYVINYLKNYKGSVYVISHDISFLNEIIHMILYLDKRTHQMELYEGDYHSFQKQLKEQEENQMRLFEKEQKEREKLEDFINKYSSSSGKRKQMVKDREKKLEKLNKESVKEVRKGKLSNMKLNMNREGNLFPLRVNHVSFGYTEPLFQNLSFDLPRGEKFLIMGENGVGKSTLLKLIVGLLKPDSGEIKLGPKTDIGYYAQEHEGLSLDQNIMQNFEEFDLNDHQLRNYLGHFLFFGDDVFKKVSVLSPGERSRIALAKLSLKGANFLVLDEPTNHLDPETQKMIAKVFQTFEGTMLVVSHNPEFVDYLGIERTLTLPSGILSYYDRKTVEHYQKLNTRKK